MIKTVEEKVTKFTVTSNAAVVSTDLPSLKYLNNTATKTIIKRFTVYVSDGMNERL